MDTEIEVEMKTPEALPMVPVACCAPGSSRAISDEEAVAVATVVKALADPHRIRIVNLLANAPEAVCVCDFTEPLGLSQPTVSFHLKKLLDAGLVDREQRGTWAHYSLRPESFERLSAAFTQKEA